MVKGGWSGAHVSTSKEVSLLFVDVVDSSVFPIIRKAATDYIGNKLIRCAAANYDSIAKASATELGIVRLGAVETSNPLRDFTDPESEGYDNLAVIPRTDSKHFAPVDVSVFRSVSQLPSNACPVSVGSGSEDPGLLITEALTLATSMLETALEDTRKTRPKTVGPDEEEGLNLKTFPENEAVFVLSGAQARCWNGPKHVAELFGDDSAFEQVCWKLAKCRVKIKLFFADMNKQTVSEGGAAAPSSSAAAKASSDGSGHGAGWAAFRETYLAVMKQKLAPLYGEGVNVDRWFEVRDLSSKLAQDELATRDRVTREINPSAKTQTDLVIGLWHDYERATRVCIPIRVYSKVQQKKLPTLKREKADAKLKHQKVGDGFVSGNGVFSTDPTRFEKSGRFVGLQIRVCR